MSKQSYHLIKNQPEVKVISHIHSVHSVHNIAVEQFWFILTVVAFFAANYYFFDNLRHVLTES